MTGEYGIGRVPTDVDPADEARARAEAAAIVAGLLAYRQPAGDPVRCPRCGETAIAGRYPFSTHGHTHDRRRGTMICDDCGA